VQRRQLLLVGLFVLVMTAVLPAQTADAPAQARPSFSEFLTSVRTEALARGIRADIIDQAFADIEEPSAVVIERDRSQAEIVQTLEKYLSQRVTEAQVATAREMLVRHHDLLEEISATYGVPPSLIVSIWGFESNFGRFSGTRPTVAALATLAWDPRRSALFHRELLASLEILNRGDIDLPSMKGSWAGAMGQVQFIPSSYLQYAEDYDGDGRRDIWSTTADVFASIANYMHGSGWIDGEAWGREVKVSHDARRHIVTDMERRNGSCSAKRDMSVILPVSRWRELGVTAVDGAPLSDDMPDAAMVTGESRTFLVYRNYDALLEYNCAHSYAIGVGLLADSMISPSDTPRVAKAALKKAQKKAKRAAKAAKRRTQPKS
jgi:membrane-bound lytic murein transglycosylase B